MSRTRLLIAGPLLAAAVVLAAAPAGAATHPSLRLPGIGTFLAPAGSRAMTVSPLQPGDGLTSVSCATVAGHQFCLSPGTSGTNSTARGIDIGSAGNGWTQLSNLALPPLKNKVVLPIQVSCAPSAATPVCMAVGEHFSKPTVAAPLAEVLSGGKWAVVASYNTPGVIASVLTGVSCPTSTFCLVTGLAVTSSGVHPTVHTWSNGTWAPVAAPPAPAGAAIDELTGVSCVSAANCEGVGLYDTSQGVTSYGAAWTGGTPSGTWQVQAMSGLTGNQQAIAFGVSCTRAPTAMCMATGTYLNQNSAPMAEIYAPATGGAPPTWQILSTPARSNAALDSVSCPVATECFASGISGNYALLEIWKNGAWHILRDGVEGTPTGTALWSISCLSVTYCAAAGDRFPTRGKGTAKTLIEVWGGTGWTVKGTPNP